ncbi:hypothetical protein BDN67DRAFT_379198 [Paxillus ammoniavirescens]|nr:hypothetical protein BDN67DRAFT_379198 [Paxillus ammoniavirescens]
MQPMQRLHLCQVSVSRHRNLNEAHRSGTRRKKELGKFFCFTRSQSRTNLGNLLLE